MRLPAHKCTAYYANDRANNSPRKRSARTGRAFCAHFVYICTQQLIVHIRTWYIGSECSHSIDLSCHVYRSVRCGYRRCLSPILFHRLSPVEKPSTVHVWHRFSLHFFLPVLHFLPPPLSLSFFLSLSLFLSLSFSSFGTSRYTSAGGKGRERMISAEAFGGE